MPIRLRAAAAALALATFAAPALAEDVVRFGTATMSLIVSPLMLAEVDPAIMAKHGIKLELTDFRGKTENCITSVIGDSNDICLSNTATGADAIVEGAPLKVIAIMSRPINEFVLSAKAAQASGVAPDAPIEDRIKAMKGMRFASATPGSAHYATIRAMMESVGLSMNDLQYQTLNEPAAMIEALRNDALDGAMWSAGALGTLIEEGKGVRWVSLPRGDVPSLADLPYIALYAKADWIEKNPAVVTRLREALAEAAEAIRADPAGTSAKIKAQYFPQMNQFLWDDAFDQSKNAFFKDGKAPRQGWDKLLELQHGNTGKDYAKAAFEIAVIPEARAD